jgi:LuxR family maltose regulon positive regulatory protein
MLVSAFPDLHITIEGDVIAEGDYVAERWTLEGTHQRVTPMTTPLLTTKLYIPPVRLDLVSRPRPIEKLNEGLRLNRKLTLMSAPAGYGKTTLLSEWVHQADLPVAWLSLDKEDNDPTRFLTYTIAALQKINDITETASDSQISSSISSGQTFTRAHVLILDDYHVIEADAVDSAVEFLFDH